MNARLATGGKKVVLLDFDGVIYKNHFAHRIIAERSSRFCGKYLNKCSDYGIDKIHTHLYKTYGHTVIGLQKMGFDVTVQEYNDYVFSKLNLYGMDNEFDNKKEFLDMLTNCNNNGVGVYIFSNAPSKWVVPLLEKMDIHMDEGSIIEPIYLKPTEEMYDQMDERFKGNQIYFVDDNMVNFKNLYDRDNWVKIHFSDTNERYDKNLYAISRLEYVKNLVMASNTIMI